MATDFVRTEERLKAAKDAALAGLRAKQARELAEMEGRFAPIEAKAKERDAATRVRLARQEQVAKERQKGQEAAQKAAGAQEDILPERPVNDAAPEQGIGSLSDVVGRFGAMGGASGGRGAQLVGPGGETAPSTVRQDRVVQRGAQPTVISRGGPGTGGAVVEPLNQPTVRETTFKENALTPGQILQAKTAERVAAARLQQTRVENDVKTFAAGVASAPTDAARNGIILNAARQLGPKAAQRVTRLGGALRAENERKAREDITLVKIRARVSAAAKEADPLVRANRIADLRKKTFGLVVERDLKLKFSEVLGTFVDIRTGKTRFLDDAEFEAAKKTADREFLKTLPPATPRQQEAVEKGLQAALGREPTVDEVTEALIRQGMR